MAYIKTNYSGESAENPLNLASGAYNLRVQIGEPPTLTVRNYVAGIDELPEIGSKIEYQGYRFFLSNSSYKESTVLLSIGANDKIRFEVSLTYKHESTLLTSKNINTADFIRQYAKQAIPIGQEFYRFPLFTLILAAKNESFAVNCDIMGLSGYVNLPYRPSNTEFFSLKTFLDDRALVEGKIATYTASNVVYTKLGGKGRVSGKPIGDVTLVENEIPTYKNTLLNWSGNTNANINAQYVEVVDDAYILYEGSSNPHIAPKEAASANLVPRDLSIMIDNGNLSKEFKITKYRFGKPAYEISGVYGYAHAALELISNPEAPNNVDLSILNKMTENPAIHGNALQEMLKDLSEQALGVPGNNIFSRSIVWRLTSIKQTEYIYKPLELNLSPMVLNSNGEYIKVTIPPAYQKFLTSNVEVLEKEITTGWSLKRFATEDNGNWSKGSIEAYFNLKGILTGGTPPENNATALKYHYLKVFSAKSRLETFLWRKIPITEEVRYDVTSYSKYYKELDKVQWNIEYIPKAEMPGASGNQDPVPVLFPDPNWEPQLMVSARSRYAVSIGLCGNPAYVDTAPSLWGKNPLSLTTGEETKEYLKYLPLPSKNTKPLLSEVYSRFCDLEGLKSSVNSNQFTPGTYHQPFPYMNVPDYGLERLGYAVPIDTASLNIGDLGFSFSRNVSNKEDSYSTLSSIRTSSDNSFQSNILNSTFTVTQGRPPAATLRRPILKLNPDLADRQLYDTLTYITSNVRGTSMQILSDVTIPKANSLQEALEGAKTKLQYDIFSSGSSLSATMAWDSKIEPNDSFSHNGGKWIVKDAERVVQFVDRLAFKQPIAMNCGELVPVDLRWSKVIVPQPGKGELSVVLDIQGLPSNLDEVPDEFYDVDYAGRWVTPGASGLTMS